MPRTRSRAHVILGDIVPRVLACEIRRDDILVEVARRSFDDGFNEPGINFSRRMLENRNVVVFGLDVGVGILLRVGGQQVEFLSVCVCLLLKGWCEALRQAFELFDFEADSFDDVLDFVFVVQGPDDFGTEAWFRLGCVASTSGAADVHLLQFFSHAGDVVGFVFWLVAFGGLAQAFEVVVYAF